MDDNGLNLKQEKFCRFYVKYGEARKAAIEAGYSPKSAHVQASYLINNQKCIKFISKLKAELVESINVSQAELLTELKGLAFSDLGDFIDWDANGITYKSKKDIPNHLRRQIESIEEIRTEKGVGQYKVRETRLKIKLYNKLKALDMIARHIKFYGEDEDNAPKIVFNMAYDPNQRIEAFNNGRNHALQAPRPETIDIDTTSTESDSETESVVSP